MYVYLFISCTFCNNMSVHPVSTQSICSSPVFRHSLILVSDKVTPTPFYNNTVLQDLTLTQNMEFLQRTLGNNTNIRDGISLLKVWLQQRELTQVFYYF